MDFISAATFLPVDRLSGRTEDLKMKKQMKQDKKNMKNTTPVALTLAALAAALVVNGCAKLQDDDEDDALRWIKPTQNSSR
jgi:uncharacterized OsmC-like protein